MIIGPWVNTRTLTHCFKSAELTSLTIDHVAMTLEILVKEQKIFNTRSTVSRCQRPAPHPSGTSIFLSISATQFTSHASSITGRIRNSEQKGKVSQKKIKPPIRKCVSYLEGHTYFKERMNRNGAYEVGVPSDKKKKTAPSAIFNSTSDVAECHTQKPCQLIETVVD